MTTTISEKLPLFEDEPVDYAEVRITNAGDGLSEALKIAPEALHMDQEVFYVLRGEVSQINHRRKSDDGPIVRVHTVKASQITKVDPELAREMLAKAADELEKAKAQAAGQLLLDAENEAAAKEAND